MKKIFKSLLPAGVVTIAMGGIMASCGNTESGNMSFESFELSEVADGADSDSLRNQLDDFDGRWDVKTSGVLPVKLGDKDMSELRDSLYAMAGVVAEEGKLKIRLPEELKPLEEKKDSEGKENAPKKDARPGSTLEREISIDLLTPSLAVFHCYTYSYPEGAAHGGYANAYLNYDIASGKIVTMQSLFTAGFEKLLLPAIRLNLEASETALLVDLGEVGLPSQFRITDSGVDFIYGIYEIAPYAAGEPTVSFSFGELESILTPAGKKLLLGN